ncbi:MAG: PD-(D/E)XK nuclease family protein, partial [Candidatus Aminicenantes bacterium]
MISISFPERSTFESVIPRHAMPLSVSCLIYDFKMAGYHLSGSFKQLFEMLDKPLIGEFDLTVERDGVYTVVDWKTSARRWPKDRARTDLQPTCYLWAHFRGAGDSSARFRFDVV